jgi:hypothetical protein
MASKRVSLFSLLPPWLTAATVLGALIALGAFAATATAQAQEQPASDAKEKDAKKKDSPGFAPAEDTKDDEKKDDSDKAQTDKAKDKDAEDETKSSMEVDREALPRGVVVPSAKLAEFAINDPKTTDEQWKNWNRGKAHGEFQTRVQNGDHDSQSDKIVQDGIREQLAAMTLPALRDPKAERFQINEIVQGLLRYVRQAANKKPAGDQRQYRIFLMDQIVKDARDLQLAKNHYYVRLNTAVLLGNLFTEISNPGSTTEPEFYTPAFDALMDILETEGQSEGVKLVALNGLKNACRYGNPPVAAGDNARLAKKLISELEKPGTHEWYQVELCETLSAIDQTLDLDRQPSIVQELSKVMFDASRPLCARGAAAKGLGRAALDPSIDLGVIAYGVADLCRQMVEARNEGKRHVSRLCIADIFLAFQPKDTPEKSRRVGLLDRAEEPTFLKYKKKVTDAWAIVKPVVIEEFRHRAEPDIEFPEGLLPPIVEWLKTNAPPALRISPNMPPVTTTQVTKVDSNGNK